MKKRGQVTIFVILGIIIVAIVGLFLFAKDTILYQPTPERLNQELESISDHITSCVLEAAPDCIEKISLQGGYFETPEGTFRLWNSTSVSYLCYNKQNDERCINRALTLSTLEGEVKKCIDQQLGPLGTCLNVKQFEGIGKPIEITAPQMPQTSVDVKPDKVLISLDYPVVIKSKKDNQKAELTEPVEVSLNYPLGKLYDLAVNVIVDSEAQYGDFEQFLYMITKRGEFMIYKHKPYPDKIYILKTRDHPLLFQFYIQGEPS